MWYRCDSLPGPDPGGTFAMGLKDISDFSYCSGVKIYHLGGSRPKVLSTSVCVIVAKLDKFRVLAATRSDERMPTTLEGMTCLRGSRGKCPRFLGGHPRKGKGGHSKWERSSVLYDAITATYSA